MIDWKVRTYDLVLGMISIFIAIGIIIWQYSYISGLASIPEGHIVVTRPEGFLVWTSLILFFGLMGGFEIGRYVQAQVVIRKEK